MLEAGWRSWESGSYFWHFEDNLDPRPLGLLHFLHTFPGRAWLELLREGKGQPLLSLHYVLLIQDLPSLSIEGKCLSCACALDTDPRRGESERRGQFPQGNRPTCCAVKRPGGSSCGRAPARPAPVLSAAPPPRNSRQWPRVEAARGADQMEAGCSRGTKIGAACGLELH